MKILTRDFWAGFTGVAVAESFPFPTFSYWHFLFLGLACFGIIIWYFKVKDDNYIISLLEEQLKKLHRRLTSVQYDRDRQYDQLKKLRGKE